MTKRKRKVSLSRIKKKKKSQKGGTAPIFVDFKQGIKVTKDMIKSLQKPVDYQKAKRQVSGYKREYQEYKRRGGTRSYNSWVVHKGYGKRNAGCCIM